LADLVEFLLAETEILRLRLSSIEPWDITPALIDLITEDRVARHLHLPLQSGSASTLRRMSRAITPKRYQRLIETIRSQIPDIAITTDILTGFPGESEEEFQEGLEFIQKMEFAGGHVFTFSARRGTPAADFPDQVPHPIRKERSAAIRQILQVSGEKYRNIYLEQELSVLWEQFLEKDAEGGRLIGLTDNYLRVESDGPGDLWNQFSTVRIDDLIPGGLRGTIIKT
jgi:threonylcarbamoyladenosine tRNA methylthiotransferase MtaB